MVVVTPTKKARILHMREDGSTFREIGNRLGINASTAQRNFEKLGENRDVYEPTHRSGCPRILSASGRRFCARKICSGQAQNAADLQRDYFPEASKRTVRRNLTEEGLPGRRMRKKFFLKPIHRKKRKAWAAAHENWTSENWNAVVYSDESKFNLCGSDGIQWCRRGPGEELDERNVRQEIKHGGGSVMVWGCMTSHGFGRLHLVEGRMNAVQYVSILEDAFLGTLQDQNIDRRNIYFQQDNDPKHTSKLAKAWFQDNHIDVLDWAPNSPDMNIIESAWMQLASRMTLRNPRPSNTTELFSALQEEWAGLSKDYCASLYESIPRRINALSLAKGKWTKY